MKSWKTTIAGIGMILGALAKGAEALSGGTALDLALILPLVIGGIGLMFAKDSNVTGGTIKQ
jgi:hypothetical protein